MEYSKSRALPTCQIGWKRRRAPPLVLVDPQDAVAEVVVTAEHVGEGVVDLVVAVLPLRGRARVVHSHAVEWIFGSRIQSHWPCMTLWPISMFSRILATERPAVPSHQAGRTPLTLTLENSSTARLLISR